MTAIFETDKKITAPNSPTAIGEGQLPQKTNDSILDINEECNSSFEKFEEPLKRNCVTNPSYLSTMTMNELYETSFENRAPLIEGLLYSGIYLFVGAPKIGKSFLMLQLAHHISTGTDLWGYKVQKGTVLYLALEDNFQRLQKRMYRMFETESTENLFFSVSASTINEKLDDQLNNFVLENPDTKLIIIDTLQKVRMLGAEKYSYANDYEVIAKLKNFADKNGICLLLVHHTRKQTAEDVFETISGTNGLLGAADGAFILSKSKRTSNKASLEISGRDQQDQAINLVRNESTLCWEFESVETELWKEPPDPILEEIAKHISEENDQWFGSPTDLVDLLKLDMKANALTLKLNVNSERLLNEYRIKYEYKRYHEGRRIRLTYMPE